MFSIRKIWPISLISKLASSKDRWTDPEGTEPRDEYGKARFIAEGEGVGATKAAYVLGAVCIGLTVALIVMVMDNRAISKLNNLQYVEVVRNGGEIVSSTVLRGELQADDAVIRWFLEKWIDQIRGVPSDEVTYNRGWFEAQQFMFQSVQGRLEKSISTDANDPNKLTPKLIISKGMTRRVQVTNVTPRAGLTNSYRIDWLETMYHNSKAIDQATATADLEIRFVPVTNAEQAKRNPYGMYVSKFDWSGSVGW